MIIARTKPIEETPKPIDGLSLFFARIDQRYMDIRPIRKHGLQSIASNQLLMNELPVPVEDRIGEDGKGFRYLLDSINPERIIVAAMAIGIGQSSDTDAGQVLFGIAEQLGLAVAAPVKSVGAVREGVLAPIGQPLALSYVAERVLGLPKSY